jgi:hypothetical protein
MQTDLVCSNTFSSKRFLRRLLLYLSGLSLIQSIASSLLLDRVNDWELLDACHYLVNLHWTESAAHSLTLSQL